MKPSHFVTPFERRFRDETMVFCREPKNRHIKLQTSNGRNVARFFHTLESNVRCHVREGCPRVRGFYRRAI